jgi:large subunit ribosomal protein L4
MKVDVLNLKGEKIEELELKKEVFGFESNSKVLSQYIRVFRANQRQGTSSTKTRSEVSGGGAKPWRQKGTGRARHGSTRSPIWVHGGVAHGPKPKVWNLSIPKGMKIIALKSALSDKFTEGKVKVIDNVKISKPKTKEFSDFLKKIKITDSVSVIYAGDSENLVKSSRNLPNVRVVNSGRLGAYDVLKTSEVIFVKEAILKIQERLTK